MEVTQAALLPRSGWGEHHLHLLMSTGYTQGKGTMFSYSSLSRGKGHGFAGLLGNPHSMRVGGELITCPTRLSGDLGEDHACSVCSGVQKSRSHLGHGGMQGQALPQDQSSANADAPPGLPLLGPVLPLLPFLGRIFYSI